MNVSALSAISAYYAKKAGPIAPHTPPITEPVTVKEHPKFIGPRLTGGIKPAHPVDDAILTTGPVRPLPITEPVGEPIKQGPTRQPPIRINPVPVDPIEDPILVTPLDPAQDGPIKLSPIAPHSPPVIQPVDDEPISVTPFDPAQTGPTKLPPIKDPYQTPPYIPPLVTPPEIPTGSEDLPHGIDIDPTVKHGIIKPHTPPVIEPTTPPVNDEVKPHRVNIDPTVKRLSSSYKNLTVSDSIISLTSNATSQLGKINPINITA